jgi:hypothetical protein
MYYQGFSRNPQRATGREAERGGLRKMRKAAGLFSLVFLCGLAAPVGAEPVPKAQQAVLDRVEVSIAPTRARRGETVILRVHLDLKERARTYPTQDPKSEVGDILEPFRVKGPESTLVVPVGELREPTWRTVEDPILGSWRVVEGHATWERSVVVLPGAKPGEHKIAVKVTGRIVNDRM